MDDRVKELRSYDHMGFVYKRAGMEDIELLVKTRIEVLRAANRLGDDAEMSLVEQSVFSG